MIIQSWDTASKGGPDNDWSVCTTWLWPDNCQWYLLDVWRGRLDYPGLKAKVVELSRQWGANQVLIEEAGTAIGILAEIKHDVAGLTGIKPDKDKQTRMSIVSAAFEAGEVYFPDQANWLAELEAELFSFPASRHNDQVDSISQAINHGRSSSLATFRKLGAASPAFATQRPAYFSPHQNAFPTIWRYLGRVDGFDPEPCGSDT